jgi:hypothetical protein
MSEECAKSDFPSRNVSTINKTNLVRRITSTFYDDLMIENFRLFLGRMML